MKVLPVKEPHNCFNTGNNDDMYVSSMGSNEIDVIDLKKMDYSARISTGGIPRPYAVSKDEKVLYTALTNLHGFAIAADLGRGFSSNGRENKASIVDLKTLKLIQQAAGKRKCSC